MTLAATRHRDLDRRFAGAVGEPGHQHALLPPRQRLEDLVIRSTSRVLPESVSVAEVAALPSRVMVVKPSIWAVLIVSEVTASSTRS